jgi:L-cysteine/cystine lyase
MDAAARQLGIELDEGRSGALHAARLEHLCEELREALAELVGAGPEDVALTHSTTDGVNVVLAGLDLHTGDEVVTSDEEHPGLLGPLGELRRRKGVSLRIAPFASVAEAVSSRTCLVAVSHVSWMTGSLAPLEELRTAGAPLLLDGAQGAGAVPVDVAALGCDYYAASGQKWLCGPSGTGFLYVRPDRREGLGMPRPAYGTIAEGTDPLELEPRAGSRCFDTLEAAGPVLGAALAALQTLAEPGWDSLFERARSLAARLREMLRERARVEPGGPTTLVTFTPRGATDPAAAVATLAERGVVVRAIPGTPSLRASVGAWSNEEDLERLVRAL